MPKKRKTNSKIFILIILLFWSYNLFPNEKIDLVKECKEGDCKNRLWSFNNHFKENYVNLSDSPEGWKKVKNFPINPNDYFSNESNFGEYTLYTNFYLSENFLSTKKAIGLQLAGIGEVYSVYINSNLILHEGKSKNKEVILNRYSYQSVWEIKDRYLNPGLNHLVIHFQGNPNFSASLFDNEGYYIGYYSDLMYDNRNRIGEILTALYFFVGLYHLLLFLKRRNERYNAYFAFYAILLFFYYIPRHGYFYEYGFDSVIGFRFELCVLFLCAFNYLLFLGDLLIKRIYPITKVYVGLSCLLAFLCVFVPESYLMLLLHIWQFFTLATLIPVSFYIFYKSMQAKNKDAFRLLVGMVFLTIAAVSDVINSLYPMTNLLLVQYALFIFIIGIVAILTNRFLNLYQTVEILNQDLNELNANLEKKVEKRTLELRTSLNEIKLLKEKQDGDYFLTTLIFKPLALNRVHSQNIKVDFLIRQKKKFEFKNRTHEIGGDICVADIIHLQNKEFTVFINGDAMGKSIQGAGGAIVLGVVFNSLIARTKLIEEMKHSSPEQWLKTSFIELQNIFESFDGSMMISVVLGLIENETGLMYFINAEHPWTTLYRDGKASFIEEELLFHKIGMIGLSGSLVIRTFQLQHRDVIFIGSDGRDDINLSKNETGIRDINEDETLFLKNVESGKGELIKVFESIENAGELTDDCSLLRIEYEDKRKGFEISKEFALNYKKGKAYYKKEQYEEALKFFQECYSIYPFHEHLLKFLGNAYFKVGEYIEATKYYQMYVDLFPWDNKGLFQVSNCYKFIKEYSKAAQVGERLKLREPQNIQYLINLIEIYIHLGNFNRARKLFNDGIKLVPNHEGLLKLQKELTEVK